MSKVTKLEDLEPFLEQVKDEVTIPFNAGAFRNYYYDTFSFITDYAGVRQDDLTTVVSIPESEEFKAHVSLMWDWYQKGYIPDWLAVDQSSTSNYLTGESGDYAVTPWNNVPDNEGIYYSQKGHYGTFVQFSEVWLDSNSALGSCYAINAKSSKAEAAIKFIEALETDRTVGALAVFGQKDVNYTCLLYTSTVNVETSKAAGKRDKNARRRGEEGQGLACKRRQNAHRQRRDVQGGGETG